MNRYRQLQKLLGNARANGTTLTCKLTVKQTILEDEWQRINRTTTKDRLEALASEILETHEDFTTTVAASKAAEKRTAKKVEEIAPAEENTKSNRNEAAAALKKVEKMFLKATKSKTFKDFQGWLNDRIPDRRNETIEQLRLVWERGTGYDERVKAYFGSNRRKERYGEALDALYDMGIHLPWS